MSESGVGGPANSSWAASEAENVPLERSASAGGRAEGGAISAPKNGPLPACLEAPTAIALEDLVQPLPGDELHHVVMEAVLLADAEDGHDVGMVQPGGRLRLAKKALQARGRGHARGRQDLQRHVSAQRLLLRFVDDAHAAAADFPQNAEIAQPFQRPLRRRLGQRAAARCEEVVSGRGPP